jgi:hypothetical protein
LVSGRVGVVEARARNRPPGRVVNLPSEKGR